MILDMNIQLQGIDEEFLEELDELIEDTRVEYFIIHPATKEEILTTQELCNESQRFKYTIPSEFITMKDQNCIALTIKNLEELKTDTELPLVIDSKDLTADFITALNNTNLQGVILGAKESDTQLINFVYSISKQSLKEWTQKGIKDTDYNKLGLQSDYPSQTYDEFLDVMLKEISDLTFRAEQTIAAGGTRTLLKLFKLL